MQLINFHILKLHFKECVIYFYHLQWSCKGYVFTCVCLSTGGVPQQVPPGPGTPPGTRYTPWIRYPPGPGTPPRDQVHPPDSYCCRRYASYWNAFLLINNAFSVRLWKYLISIQNLLGATLPLSQWGQCIIRMGPGNCPLKTKLI